MYRYIDIHIQFKINQNSTNNTKSTFCLSKAVALFFLQPPVNSNQNWEGSIADSVALAMEPILECVYLDCER